AGLVVVADGVDGLGGGRARAPRGPLGPVSGTEGGDRSGPRVRGDGASTPVGAMGQLAGPGPGSRGGAGAARLRGGPEAGRGGGEGSVVAGVEQRSNRRPGQSLEDPETPDVWSRRLRLAPLPIPPGRVRRPLR